MDYLLSALASTFLYLNPVHFDRQVTMEQFILFTQLSLILILAGLCAMTMFRAGMSRTPVAVISAILAFFMASYLFARGGNPFDLAERFCVAAGSLFRFAGGVGVAAGLVFLFGIRNLRYRGHRLDIFHPIVLVAMALYGFLCFETFRFGFVSQSTQVGMALSVAAAWVSFAGIFGLVRHCCGHMAEERLVTLIALGCLMLVFLTYLHTPFSDEYRLLYSGSFPAGVFAGSIAMFVWI